MIRILLPLAVLAILLPACAPRRAAVLLNTEATPPDLLLKMVGGREAELSSLVGSGILTFDSPEMAGSASFESNMKKPDSLLIVLSGPFGIDVGTLFLSREKYVIYNSLENSVFTGNPSDVALRSLIPFDLTYDQILNAFAGVFTIGFSKDDLRGYVVEGDQFHLTFSCGTNTCAYWVDPAYLLITRFEQRDAGNNILVEATASAFTEEDDVAAARRVQITFPQQNRQLSIAYNSLKLNDPDTDFRYSIPPNAKVRVR